MVSKFALLTNLLLASAVLAAPPSDLETRRVRRGENRGSQPARRVDSPDGTPSNTVYTSNWAGAVWEKGNGAFTRVTGTFTVPKPSGNPGDAATAWVGIDGDTCQNAILQTGVDFNVGSNGQVSYDAWYEWYPDYAYYFSGIAIRTGDVINATVVAQSTTSGVAIIENLTTGTQVTHNFSSQPALCLQDAEWIVEDFEEGGNLVPFANFGTVTFSSATASGSAGSLTPSGATVFEIEQNGQVLTSTSIQGNSVTVKYV